LLHQVNVGNFKRKKDAKDSLTDRKKTDRKKNEKVREIQTEGE